MQKTPKQPVASAETSPTDPLRSVHTSNLPDLFRQLRISLVVSTYQAGKVILIRADGNMLNTHFRTFAKPMGIAADNARLTIGGSNTVWYYRNLAAVAPKLDPPGKHDACFMPRRIHVSGDIDIHELAYDRDDELWVVNTRFGCLCTLDGEHSFYPRWRPPFLSALAPQDRCHLNGLAMQDGRPKYVTALGETDTEGGWRANKASGGILMDIDSNEILLRGLSMPHSPRVYQDQLYVLESGHGSLAQVDLNTRTWRTLAQLPGFTRGIDFIGPLAFIGLSQVREKAVFSGIPLLQRLKERTCGVWVVHIETGETLGFLRFEAGVEEIFAVQILPDMQFPELLEWGDDRLSHSYVLPDAALAEVVLPTEAELARSSAFHHQRGVAFYRNGQLADAIAAFRDCFAVQADFADVRYNLGVALGDAGEYAEAVLHMQEVIKTDPERAEAHNSLGHLANCQGQTKQAVACYEQAIAQQPDYAQAHFNLGMTLLQLGDHARGWIEYDWRWKTGQFTAFQSPHPLWDGSAIQDKTLLIHTEQGAGDAIQFARYLPLAAQRCRKLILVCSAELLPLFSTLLGVAEVRLAGTFNVADFDTYIPLLSLPRVFHTTAESIPAAHWLDSGLLKRRKGSDAVPLLPASALKVGIVWAGSPTHANDRHRSCTLTDFLPVLRTPGVSFFSLQKGTRSEELNELPPEVTVHDLGPQLNDFGDTALLIEQLDLLISVDTAVVHLAGTLGKPAWVLLAGRSDWRWGLEGDSTLWYPGLSLFRQTRWGDWGEVMERLASRLASRCAAGATQL